MRALRSHRVPVSAPRIPNTILGASLLALAIVLAQLMSYRERIDGAWTPFVVGAAGSASAAALVALWCSVTSRTGIAGALLIIAVTLPGLLIHGTRTLRQARPATLAVAGGGDVRRAFDVTLRGNARLRTDQAPPATAAISLHAPAGSTGYLELRRERAPTSWSSPRALLGWASESTSEELAWDSAIERDGAFFVLIETDRVLVQLTDRGLSISQQTGGSRVDHDVDRRVPQGERNTWTLRRAAGRISLELDGQGIWQGSSGEPFEYIRLGETRTDSMHGGTMHLSGARYRRLVAGAR
jgi:hypothetical protein